MPDSEPGHLFDLIELIYDAAEDQSRWPEFMQSLCQHLRTPRAFLVLHVPGTNADHGLIATSMQVGCPHGWTRDELELYAQRYAAVDPWAHSMNGGTDGEVKRSADLCPEEVFYSSVAYREFYGPRGCHHGCGAMIKRAPEGMSFLTMTRPKEAGAYSDNELSILSHLLPHLCRSARLVGELVKLRSQLDAVRHVVDLSPQGFLQMDAGGGLIYANEAARNDEILSFDSGRVRLQARNGDARFREAVRSALSDRPRLRRLDVESASDGTRRRLLLIPGPESMGGTFRADHPTLSILVIDGASPTKPDPAILAELFSLTPAEARFTAYLAAGFDMREIAPKLKITRETARTHLRRVLSKTDTRRQGELISLVLRSVPFRQG